MSLRTLINKYRAKVRLKAWVNFYYVGSSPKLHAGYLDRERFTSYRVVTFCGQDVGGLPDPRVPGYPPHSSVETPLAHLPSK